MLTNRILATDSYKFSHAWQYPPGTTEVSAYIETRAGARFKEITSFGLQMFLKEQLSYPVTKEHIDEAEALVLAHGLPFNRAGWEIVLKEHGGMLPLEIQALPEGMTFPLGTPLVQVRNTDPRLPWLTTFVETALLRAVWYPSTVATVSRQAKKIIYAGLQRSSDDPDGQIPFKLHDFGARGVTSGEQAALGGCAHLVNFMGTDTVEGLVAARRYYGAEMAGFSIPAAEHSTITAWGRDGEIDAYRNMLTRFGGKGKLVAVVSDSYDVQNAVRNIWGGALKSAVIATEGTLVVRPDFRRPDPPPGGRSQGSGQCLRYVPQRQGLSRAQSGGARDPGRRHEPRDDRGARAQRHRCGLLNRQHRVRHGWRPAAEGRSRYDAVRHEGQRDRG